MEFQVLLGRERSRVYAVGGGTYVMGRGSDCDLVLASDIVSRSHARLVVGTNDVKVTDLGSSNGTYINGARVLGEGTILEGDIVLVGDVALQLNGRPSQMLPSSVATSLIEVPPATLLRYLAVIKKTCVLVLTSPPLQGRISFNRGHVSEVLVDMRKTRDPIQALTAILRWRGTFELDAPNETESSLLLGLDAVLPAVGSTSRPSMLPKPPRPSRP